MTAGRAEKGGADDRVAACAGWTGDLEPHCIGSRRRHQDRLRPILDVHRDPDEVIPRLAAVPARGVTLHRGTKATLDIRDGRLRGVC